MKELEQVLVFEEWEIKLYKVTDTYASNLSAYSRNFVSGDPNYF